MPKKVTLETAGVLASPLAAPPTVVDENELDDDARDRLLQLVTAADDGATAADTDRDGPGPLRDAQSYQITIEDSAGPAVVLSATDGAVSPQFAQLRDWIRENGQPHHH